MHRKSLCSVHRSVHLNRITAQDTAEPPFFENRSSVFELRDMINGAPFLLRSLYFFLLGDYNNPTYKKSTSDLQK